MKPGWTVVYDANVLFSARLRDLLMELARYELFRARWTDTILDEFIRNVAAKKPNASLDKLARTRQLMNLHAGDPLVVGFEAIVASLELPDPDDRHVLAAAIHCRAQAVVTFNLADFPSEVTRRYGIEAVHPDEFVLQVLRLDAALVREAVAKVIGRLRNPPQTWDEWLDGLAKSGMPKTAVALRQA